MAFPPSTVPTHPDRRNHRMVSAFPRPPVNPPPPPTQRGIKEGSGVWGGGSRGQSGGQKHPSKTADREGKGELLLLEVPAVTGHHPPQGVLSFTNACLSLHVHAHSLLSLGGVGRGSWPLLRRSPCLTGLFLPSGAMAGGGLSCEANPRPPPAAT